MWLSPRDFLNTTFLMIAGDADINLGHFDAAIDAYRRALDSGFREFFVYARLSAAYADAGRIDEAKASLAEARRLTDGRGVDVIVDSVGGASARGKCAVHPTALPCWYRSSSVR